MGNAEYFHQKSFSKINRKFRHYDSICPNNVYIFTKGANLKQLIIQMLTLSKKCFLFIPWKMYLFITEKVILLILWNYKRCIIIIVRHTLLLEAIYHLLNFLIFQISITLFQSLYLSAKFIYYNSHFRCIYPFKSVFVYQENYTFINMIIFLSDNVV